VPELLSALVITIFVWILFDASEARGGGYVAPSTGPLGILAYSVFRMLVSLPVMVLTYRYALYVVPDAIDSNTE
jgi:hypothetical protein